MGGVGDVREMEYVGGKGGFREIVWAGLKFAEVQPNMWGSWVMVRFLETSGPKFHEIRAGLHHQLQTVKCGMHYYSQGGNCGKHKW